MWYNNLIMATKKQSTKKTDIKSQGTPILLRQISGAVIGGSLALVVYYAYNYGSPVVTAWLISNPSIANTQTNEFADKDLSKYDKRRVESQIRAIAQATGSKNQYSSAESIEPEIADTVWEEEWKNEEPLVIEEVETDEPEITEYLSEDSVDFSTQEEEIFAEEMNSVPELPDSGFGILSLMVVAGAGAGIKMKNRKYKM